MALTETFPAKSKSSSSSARLVYKIAIGLGKIFVFILTTIVCLPVLLLPFTTAVPAWAWILLALADLAIIIARLRAEPNWQSTLLELFGLVLVSLLAIAASQFFAATPAITGTDGQPIPDSIASLEKVTLNGSEQWITIRGHDTTKPVLLNLGMGGPGGGGFIPRTLLEPLEEHFVVVSWDEPGTGKSYKAVPMASLTPQRFIDDAHALTLYLRQRFNQDKIYIYGVSWTSILGVWLADEYPDLYHAYIGNGQMVNVTETDVQGYELALQHLAEVGDQKQLETLRRNGPPPYTGDNVVEPYLAFLDVLNEYMGADRYALIVPIAPFMAPEYGYIDKINHTRGLIDSFNAVYPQLQEVDFTTQAIRLEVPTYIFFGRNDVNANASLAERYFNLLEAPRKQLFWLKGGHGLDGSNQAQFVDIMVNTVLVETYLAQ